MIEDGGQWTEVRRQMTEDRGQMTQHGSQKNS